MEEDRRLLAAAYFLTNLHKATQQQTDSDGGGGVFIHNTVTGKVVWCHDDIYLIPEHTK